MALYKKIRQADGVTTNYHRILYITQTINRHTSMAVLSYVDSESRESEKESITAQPYHKAVTYETTYSPDITVAAAYDYLKTLPEFEGAEDV